MIGVQLSAVDTLYFRGSDPYAANLTSPEHLGGHFPPHPATVVGALRAWLARGNGWRGGPWGQDLIRGLGNGYGPDDLGQLRFDGPYLLRDGQPLYPLPAHLFGEEKKECSRHPECSWHPEELLRPGPPVRCDLGDRVRLPCASDACLVPGAGRWLTREGMAAVLRDEVPPADAVVRAEELWRDELRVGIARDDTTRTVQEGMLYTSRHVRPAPGITVGVRVGGAPDWWDRCGATVSLGGEGRWAECRLWDSDATCEPPLPEILDSRRVLVVALTPVDAGEECYRAGGRIPGLGDATIVSACLPRAERVGGWGSAGRDPDRQRRGPLAMRSILPAGSTFFCTVGDPDSLRAAVARADGPLRVGDRQKWGFGAVALGVWKDTMEGTT